MINPFVNPTTNQIEFPYQPLRDILFLWPEPEPEKLGSIILPEIYRDFHRNAVGIVLAIGPGFIDKKQAYKFIPSVAKVGDIVLFDQSVPWEQKVKAWDGEYYMTKLMGERDLQGIFKL